MQLLLYFHITMLPHYRIAILTTIPYLHVHLPTTTPCTCACTDTYGHVDAYDHERVSFKAGRVCGWVVFSSSSAGIHDVSLEPVFAKLRPKRRVRHINIDTCVCVCACMCIYICMCMCMHVCIYIYIYIQREREKERDYCVYVYIYIYIYIYSTCTIHAGYECIRIEIWHRSLLKGSGVCLY